MPKTEFLVVDTSAFIKNTQLQDFAEKAITCQEVLDEIKNSRQLRRLVVLPYDLEVDEPDNEDIVFVSQFSKKTGDYPALSSTDIKVIALTYKLERLKVGKDHLNMQPPAPREIQVVDHSVINDNSIVGFYMPDGTQEEDESEGSVENEGEDEKEESDEKDEDSNYNADSEDEGKDGDSNYNADSEDDEKEKSDETAKFITITRYKEDKVTEEDAKFADLLDECFDKDQGEIDVMKVLARLDEIELQDNKEPEEGECDRNDPCAVECDQNETSAVECDQNESSAVECDQNDPCAVDDDDAGWITPSNLKKSVHQMYGGTLEDELTPVKVACLTTDFAMQNVLKQIGLNIVSLDGLLIKQVKTWILRCYACFKTTPDMTRIFCHNCGNKTLKRVAVTVDPDGKEHLHINFRRPLTARGKRFPLPRFRGGKHSNNPILSEDQRVPQQRPSNLARKKTDALNPDYIAGMSPFIMRDVCSKSAMLGITNKETKSWERRNPNVVVKKKRKK